MRIDDAVQRLTTSVRKPRSIRNTRNGNATHKITQHQFSANLCLLADAAKKQLRSNMVHADWVLDSDIGKEEWIWKAILTAVGNAAEARKAALQTALHDLSRDEDMKTNFITFVSVFLVLEVVLICHLLVGCVCQGLFLQFPNCQGSGQSGWSLLSEWIKGYSQS